MSDSPGRRVRQTRRRVALLCAVLVAGASAWIGSHVVSPRRVALPCAEPAILAHRRDDVAAVRTALRDGFCGVEIDVWWRGRRGLVVTHDRPADRDDSPAPLTLASLLDSLERPPALVWLDFKNLDLGNALSAAAYLNALMARHGMRGHLIVESGRPAALALLRHVAPTVITVYAVGPTPAGMHGIAHDLNLAARAGTFVMPALSIEWHGLTPQFVRRFSQFSIFAFTCDTPDEVRTTAHRGARIILTDGPNVMLTPSRRVFADLRRAAEH